MFLVFGNACYRFTSLILFSLIFLSPAVLAKDPPPKLILQITVDQLRADLPLRYLDKMPKGGFQYLYNKGSVYADAHHNHANTETVVGHATLATGATPAVHGMIGNVWFDREEERLVYNVEDPDYPLLDKDAGVSQKTEIDPTQKKAKTSGRSPKKIMVSTFSDELALHTNQAAKIFAVSVKDRGAITMAGHAGKAFWFSKKTGDFVTSNYYYDDYPEWVNQWNEKDYNLRYAKQDWQLMHPAEEYSFKDQDDQSWEIDFPGYGRTFPHAYGEASSKYFNTLLTLSPAGDELTTEFAEQIILKEQLGKDSITDYLSVSYSSTDYVGHFFGSASLEMEDNLMRLDRSIAKLLVTIDKEVGLKNTLIVLSADHGGADSVPYSQKLGLNAHYIAPDLWDTQPAFTRLKKTFGIDKKIISAYFHPYIYLDREALQMKGLNRDAVADAIAREASLLPGVAIALPSHQIASGNLPDSELYRSVVNNHNPERSGDVFVVFEPHSFINNMDGLKVSAHHGSPWRYDTHVPIIFAGYGTHARQINRRVETVDIATTLAVLIGAKLPSGAEGKALKEVLPD